MSDDALSKASLVLQSLDEEQLSTGAEGAAGEWNCPLVKDTEKDMENQGIHTKTV